MGCVLFGSVSYTHLYGSDIQSIAAQITKLRFFISLIVDCERDASKPNFGIPTLPNLETKFVAANSLIAKKKQDRQRNLFENPEIEPTKEELAKVRHEHFMAKSASAKRRLREKDQELREKLAKLLADDNNFAPEDAIQLAAWNPYDQDVYKRQVVYPPAVEQNWKTTFKDFGIDKYTKFITNGSLNKVLDEDNYDYWNADEYDLVLVDEAHKFRSHTTNAFEQLQEICKMPRINQGHILSLIHISYLASFEKEERTKNTNLLTSFL